MLYLNKICKFNQIKIKSMPWGSSKGESYARHEIYRLFYDKQTFILNIDANFKFIKNWDIQLLKQWASTQNEFAIISTYPPQYQEDNDLYINILCNKYFMDWSWRHMLQNQIGTIETKHIFAPRLQPFISSAFYFCKAHFLIFVEFDPFMTHLWIQ